MCNFRLLDSFNILFVLLYLLPDVAFGIISIEDILFELPDPVMSIFYNRWAIDNVIINH